MLTKLKTIDDLKQFIAATLSSYNKQDDEIDVHWFVAMFEARQLLDQCSLKDVAAMLQGGTDKIDDEYVVNWLETLYHNYDNLEGEELQEYINEEGEPYQPIVAHVCYMYNIELSEEE